MVKFSGIGILGSLLMIPSSSLKEGCASFGGEVVDGAGD
jgi:hypothetical protein